MAIGPSAASFVEYHGGTQLNGKTTLARLLRPLLRRERSGETVPDLSRLPRHIAIIMDGNGRWATKRGLPRVAGHRAGVEALRGVIKTCSRLGIEVLTLYAFSTENWKRPPQEVDALMKLLVEYLRAEIDELHHNGVRIQAIGRVQELPAFDREEIARAEALTRDNTGLKVNLALNYGGRLEVTDAVRAIAEQVKAGRLRPGDITQELVADHLYTAGSPDPDLIIRTGGESRLSNFLLWQAAYSELWVTPTYWPDFGRKQLYQALSDYAARERRFGGIKSR